MGRQCVTCATPFAPSRPKQARCLTCKQEYDRQWYASNKERIGPKKNSNAAARRDKLRRFIYSYFSAHSCVDCGEADPIVLEFDHREVATKEMAISSMVTAAGASIKRIEAEIAKCDVRCANCHRRRTAKQFGWYKGIIGE